MKHYLILQPPATDYLTLLVDRLNEDATEGITTDPEKFEYNLKYLRMMNSDMDLDFDIEVKSALSKNGITSVHPIGRYILMIRISKDLSLKSMHFIDRFAWESFNKETFSERILNHIGAILSRLKLNSQEDDRLLKLLNPGY